MKKLFRKRRRPTELFRRRIIITMHPWAVALLALGLAVAIVTRLDTVMNAISVASALTALGVVLIARREVANLRHDYRRALVVMDDDDEPLEHETEIPAKPIRLVNGTSNSRISGN